MEKQANKHLKDVTFKFGYRVLLRLQPYRQQTVVKRASHKVEKRYYGPYTVIKRIDYELDLPSSLKVHPVVHVSLLRPFYGKPKK